MMTTLVRVLAAIGLLVIIVTCTPAVQWAGRRLAGPWEQPQGDVLVVLGAAVDQSGTLSYSSYLRAEYARRAFRDGHFRRMLILGGRKRTSPPVSLAMKSYMEYSGLPGGLIDTEITSISTRENALEARRFLTDPNESVVVLTSDYHAYRAERVFRKAGLRPKMWPIPDVCKRGANPALRWSAFVDLVIESAKIVYYFARRWM
jgi:uncharacterized SAM-binding protein YcdF (DUF218 family)